MHRLVLFVDESPRLDWAHKGLSDEREVEVTEEEYKKLVNYDSVVSEYEEYLEELYRR